MKIIPPVFLFHCFSSQEGSENEEEEEHEEEEEENTDYLTDSNKENETDEENNVRGVQFPSSREAAEPPLTLTRQQEVTIRGGGLKHVACAEDEDFIQALDKMMLENLQVSLDCTPKTAPQGTGDVDEIPLF